MLVYAKFEVEQFFMQGEMEKRKKNQACNRNEVRVQKKMSDYLVLHWVVATSIHPRRSACSCHNTILLLYRQCVWFGLLWATALPRVSSHNVIAYRSMLHMSTGSAARWSAPQRQHGTTIHRASHAYAKYVEIYVIHFSIVNLQRKS